MPESTTLEHRLGLILRAAAGLRGFARRTPAYEVETRRGTAELVLKLENLQRTGSFKFRGALTALRLASAERELTGCVTYSAGNHGRALASAASAAEVPATVVMPRTAEPAKVRLVEDAGARVVLTEPDGLARTSRELVEETGAEFISPFDDDRIIAGQGTVGLELLSQAEDVDAVLVPVGGGGLIAGVATVFAALKPEVEVIAVEPERAGDLAESLRVGRITPWSREVTATTIADGLRAPAVGERPWAVIEQHVTDAVTVTEEDVVDAMRLISAETAGVVEPSGAVATAAVLAHRERFAGRRVAAIVSGGNVDPGRFAELIGPR